MNRYVRGIGYALVGTVKAVVLKIERGSKVSFAFPSLISPSTEVSVDKGGSLFVGRRISMRNGSRLAVRKNGVLKIGANFYMNTGCLISAHESITIGDDVEFGPSVLVYDQDHDFRAEGGLRAKKFKTAPVTIGNNVWIGANTVILRGTEIGDDCVIGAGSIIKGIFPAGSVVVQKRLTEIRGGGYWKPVINTQQKQVYAYAA